MEASAAGLAAAPAAGDGGSADGGDAGQQDGQSQQQAQQPDVTQALQGLTELMESQRDLLASEPWKPAEAPAEEQAPDLSFLDDTQPGYTQEQAAAGLQQLVTDLASKQAQELVAPLQKQQQEMQVRMQTDDLISRYPQMGDDKVAGQVVETARQWAEQIGHPELAAEPQMWELMYLAGRAADQSNSENNAASGDAAAALEGPGGASPGGSGQGGLTAQSVTESWGGGSLPLFGSRGAGR